MKRKATDKYVALYARVSTEQQVDRDSLVNQKAQLLDHAKEKGIRYQLYEDAAQSARDTNRPAFRRLVEDVKSGAVAELVVTKLDRVSRSLIDLLQLGKELEMRDVGFKCLTQDFDSSSPTGKFQFNILGCVAQWEREMTAERVRESMQIRARRGL